MSLQGFIKKVAVQTAIYWGNPTPDADGNTAWDDPIELKVRWDDTINLVMNAKGQEVASQAVVLVAGKLEVDGTVTPMDLEVGGRMYLGSLDDLDSGQESDPLLAEGTYPIIRFDKNPEFRSTNKFVRQAYL